MLLADTGIGVSLVHPPPPSAKEGSHSNTGSSPDRQSPRSFPCTKAPRPAPLMANSCRLASHRIRIRFDPHTHRRSSQPHVDASVIRQFTARDMRPAPCPPGVFVVFVVQIFSDSRFRQLVSFGYFLEFHIVAGDSSECLQASVTGQARSAAEPAPFRSSPEFPCCVNLAPLDVFLNQRRRIEFILDVLHALPSFP